MYNQTAVKLHQSISTAWPPYRLYRKIGCNDRANSRHAI